MLAKTSQHQLLHCLVLQVIAAEGEQKSSKALKDAADMIAQSPAALQLRYLQVLGTGYCSQ